MITFNLFAVTNFKQLLSKILEWREKYNGINQTQWQRVRFDTPYLKEPIIFDMNILPKQEFMPYMHESLDDIKQNLNKNDVCKFSDLEYERFSRVVDYMETTVYDENKVQEAKRNFFNWFTEYDRRRDTDICKTFPELEKFYLECGNE